MENLKEREIKCRVNNTSYAPYEKYFRIDFNVNDFVLQMDAMKVNKENEDEVYLFFMMNFNSFIKDKSGVEIPISLEDHEEPNCTIFFTPILCEISERKLEIICAMKVTFHTKTLVELYDEREKNDKEITRLLKEEIHNKMSVNKSCKNIKETHVLCDTNYMIYDCFLNDQPISKSYEYVFNVDELSSDAFKDFNGELEVFFNLSKHIALQEGISQGQCRFEPIKEGVHGGNCVIKIKRTKDSGYWSASVMPA